MPYHDPEAFVLVFFLPVYLSAAMLLTIAMLFRREISPRAQAGTRDRGKPRGHWWQVWRTQMKRQDEEQGLIHHQEQRQQPNVPPSTFPPDYETFFKNFNGVHPTAWADIDLDESFDNSIGQANVSHNGQRAKRNMISILAQTLDYTRRGYGSDNEYQVPAAAIDRELPLLTMSSWRLYPRPKSFAHAYDLIRTFKDVSEGPVHIVCRGAQKFIVKQLRASTTYNGSFVYSSPPNEVRMFQKMSDHPNIVGLQETFLDASIPHEPIYNLVLEYCDGGDLMNFIEAASARKERVSKAFVMHFVSSMLDALAYLHHGHKSYNPKTRHVTIDRKQEQILHCDIKPQNIFLRWSETSQYSMPDIVLGDFGLARTAADNVGWAGTEGYMAPEIEWAMENPEFHWMEHHSTYSDMYSFGVSLFELVACQRYFPGKSDIRSACENSDVDGEVVISSMLYTCLDPCPENRRRAGDLHGYSQLLKDKVRRMYESGESVVSEHFWPDAMRYDDKRRGVVAEPCPANSHFRPASSVYTLGSLLDEEVLDESIPDYHAKGNDYGTLNPYRHYSSPDDWTYHKTGSGLFSVDSENASLHMEDLEILDRSWDTFPRLHTV